MLLQKKFKEHTMNFLNLYYFRVAAEELSFTNAAKRLFISQQSLSNHISRLENEFGVILFNRTQPITLTEAGKSLYASSKVLLQQKEQIEKSMQDIRDFRKGELTLGISTSRGAVMLPKILPEFRSAFPQIKLNLVEGTTKEINQALFEGRADLCIGFAINDPEKVHEELLHTESLVCVIPNSFLPRYLKIDSTLIPGSVQSFNIFADCPFIKMPKQTWLGEMFEKCCESYNIEPEILLETTSMSTMVSLCSSGIGAIVLPEIFVSRRMTFWNSFDWKEQVSVFPLNYPAGDRPITIAYMKDHYLSRAADEFIRMAQEKFSC